MASMIGEGKQGFGSEDVGQSRRRRLASQVVACRLVVQGIDFACGAARITAMITRGVSPEFARLHDVSRDSRSRF